ncbi:MAG: MBL fold metallo-hydrolase [Chthoniobacteraceae bacterium]
MTFTRLTRGVEIGANCYALELAGQRLVLDSGQNPRTDGREGQPQFDLLAPGSVDAIVVSHAHHDHLGSLPVLQRLQPQARVFLSEATRQLSDIMLHNSVNVMHRRLEQGATELPQFTHREVGVVTKRWQPVPFATRFDLHGERLGPHDEAPVALEFFDAGHILGSVGVRIRAEGRTIFYTGDVQFDDQTLSRGAVFPDEPVDVLIIETTRGAVAMEPGWTREGEEQRFATALREVFDGGGSVLIPTFALGKTQEMLALFYKMRLAGLVREDLPIYLTGLGTKLTEVHDKLAAQTRRHYANIRLLHEVEHFMIRQDNIAEQSLKPRRIYALSSGMMTEHTLSNVFARRLIDKPEHAVFFVGYCDPLTPGYALRHSAPGGLVQLDAALPPQPRNCRIERFDFSGHASRESLRAFANRVRPKKILLVHGDVEASVWFQQVLAADLPDAEVIIPAPGEPIEL